MVKRVKCTCNKFSSVRCDICRHAVEHDEDKGCKRHCVGSTEGCVPVVRGKK